MGGDPVQGRELPVGRCQRPARDQHHGAITSGHTSGCHLHRPRPQSDLIWTQGKEERLPQDAELGDLEEAHYSLSPCTGGHSEGCQQSCQRILRAAGRGEGVKVTVFQEKMGHEKMVTSQVSSESLGQATKCGSWLHTGKNSRVSHSKEDEDLFRDRDIHSIDVHSIRTFQRSV